MTEPEARKVFALLDKIDALGALRKALQKDGRKFYMCAESGDECLYADMRLPADAGVAFVESLVESTWAELETCGVVRPRKVAADA